MNVLQKLAFGSVVLVLLAWMAQQFNVLVAMIVVMAAVAILTLVTTWKVIFMTLQVIGSAVSGIGHAVGFVGDLAVRWSRQRRVALAKGSDSNVPSWDSSELAVSQPYGETADVGVDIFGPQPA